MEFYLIKLVLANIAKRPRRSPPSATREGDLKSKFSPPYIRISAGGKSTSFSNKFLYLNKIPFYRNSPPPYIRGGEGSTMFSCTRDDPLRGPPPREGGPWGGPVRGAALPPFGGVGSLPLWGESDPWGWRPSRDPPVPADGLPHGLASANPWGTPREGRQFRPNSERVPRPWRGTRPTSDFCRFALPP